jgi:hypothetical protein
MLGKRRAREEVFNGIYRVSIEQSDRFGEVSINRDDIL